MERPEGLRALSARLRKEIASLCGSALFIEAKELWTAGPIPLMSTLRSAQLGRFASAMSTKAISVALKRFRPNLITFSDELESRAAARALPAV